MLDILREGNFVFGWDSVARCEDHKWDAINADEADEEESQISEQKSEESNGHTDRFCHSGEKESGEWFTINMDSGPTGFEYRIESKLYT